MTSAVQDSQSRGGPPIRTAVVVGAGLSGLAAAYRLRQAGVDVTVLERGPGPGGRVQTQRMDGYTFDCGPDALTARYTSYLGLIEELGLSDRVVECHRTAGIIRDGRIHDVDPTSLRSMITTPALSWKAKLRLAAGYARVLRGIRDVDAYELVQYAHDGAETTAYEYSAAIFGDEVTEYLIDPMMRLVTGSGAREVSHLNVLAALKSWTVPILNIRGGLDVLPKALADQVDVRYGTEVLEVDERDNGVQISYLDPEGSLTTLSVDACVISAMYDVAAKIWQPLRSLAPDFEGPLRYVEIISVSLGYQTLTNSDAYIVQVPTCEYPDALLVFMQHHKAPDRAPEGHSLVTIYTDTTATPRYMGRSDDEIIAWAADTVESVCPELAGQRTIGHVTRWPQGSYLATPGFWERSRTLLDALPERGRVQLAGDLFGAGSMESAVRWGERAAFKLQGAGSPAARATI